MENNGYKYAELARGEALTSPETCDCCGRQGLKKTVKLVNPGGRVVWYGTGCAAKAMGGEQKLVEKKRKEAIKRADDAERKARQAKIDADSMDWFCFLSRTAGAMFSWDGKIDRFAQIQKLGGMTEARRLYREEQERADFVKARVDG